MRSGFRPWPPLQRTSEQTRSCPRIGLAATRFLGLVLESQVQKPGNRGGGEDDGPWFSMPEGFVEH